MFVRELFFAYESILCVITVNIKENLNAFTASRPNNEHFAYFYIQFGLRYWTFSCIYDNLVRILHMYSNVSALTLLLFFTK